MVLLGGAYEHSQSTNDRTYGSMTHLSSHHSSIENNGISLRLYSVKPCLRILTGRTLSLLLVDSIFQISDFFAMQDRNARHGLRNPITTYVTWISTILLYPFQKAQALSDLAEPHWDIPSPPASLPPRERANR